MLYFLFSFVNAQIDMSGGNQAFAAQETSPTVTRVERTVQMLNEKLTQVEEIERLALINIDKELQMKPHLGKSVMDKMTHIQRLNEQKEYIRRSKQLQPKLLQKMREVLDVLPKRDRFRLIRKIDLRKRFSLGTELDTA
ncbi:Uncharacterized protein QTN25_008893 [Entamoeba marina]